MTFAIRRPPPPSMEFFPFLKIVKRLKTEFSGQKTPVFVAEKKLNDRRHLPLNGKIHEKCHFFNLDIQAHNVYLPAKGVRGAEIDP